MDSLTAADIMARSEATLSPEAGVYDAMARLLKSRLTGAPVVDDEGQLLGMLTERDCLKVLVGAALDGLPSGKVADYMTAPAESIQPTASLFDIAHIFLTRSFRKLPVVASVPNLMPFLNTVRIALTPLSALGQSLVVVGHLPCGDSASSFDCVPCTSRYTARGLLFDFAALYQSWYRRSPHTRGSTTIERFLEWTSPSPRRS